MTTVHVVALPHLDPVRASSTCAYSQKIRRLGGMLRANGHRAILYAGPASDGDYDEHVAIVTPDDRQRWFGVTEWPAEKVFDRWDPDDRAWVEMADQAIVAIRRRIEPNDIIGIIAGRAQAPIVDAFPANLALEWGVGYQGVSQRTYRVFESHAWRTFVAGRYDGDQFRAFDTVIPNSWEPGELARGDGQGGYFLFMGRLMARKGPQVAAETCRRIGARLVVAGQGVATVQPGRITLDDGTLLEGDVEYAGIAGPVDRSRLMGEAIATFAPTQYLEPFGGVAVESMLTGTPAITTAWGAFPELVSQGETGYLCSTLDDFAQAAGHALELDRAAIADRAELRFTTPVVGRQYARHLDRLETLWGDGWYAWPDMRAPGIVVTPDAA